jgi:hypothetical protein
MFNGTKYYCLKCETTNACKCNCEDNHLFFNHKLRPPKSTANKRRFRDFIDNCPSFLNCVNIYNLGATILFLKKIKYSSEKIEEIKPLMSTNLHEE